jgi:hypothetical protein
MPTREKKNRSCASPANSRFGVLRLSHFYLVFPSGSLAFLYIHFLSARFTRYSPGRPRPAKKNRSCASPSNLRPKRRIWFSSICPEAIHNFPFRTFSDTLSCATSARRPKPVSHCLCGSLSICPAVFPEDLREARDSLPSSDIAAQTELVSPQIPCSCLDIREIFSHGVCITDSYRNNGLTLTTPLSNLTCTT